MYPRVGEVDEDSAQRIAAAIAGTSSLDEAAAALQIPSSVLKASLADPTVQRACGRFRSMGVSIATGLMQTMALAIRACNDLLVDPTVSHELRFQVVQWVFEKHGGLLSAEHSVVTKEATFTEVRNKVISLLERQKAKAAG